jgi:hypothetical protein
VRPIGYIKVTDPRGYAYLPKIIRKEVNCRGKEKIPFYIDANIVLLIRKDADLKAILKGLEILKKDLILRAEKEVKKN